MVYLLGIVPKPDIKDVTPMDALEHARAEIDEVDAQLAALFERRMAAVLQVASVPTACRSLMPRGKPPCWKRPPPASTPRRCALIIKTMSRT